MLPAVFLIQRSLGLKTFCPSNPLSVRAGSNSCVQVRRDECDFSACHFSNRDVKLGLTEALLRVCLYCVCTSLLRRCFIFMFIWLLCKMEAFSPDTEWTLNKNMRTTLIYTSMYNADVLNNSVSFTVRHNLFIWEHSVRSHDPQITHICIYVYVHKSDLYDSYIYSDTFDSMSFSRCVCACEFSGVFGEYLIFLEQSKPFSRPELMSSSNECAPGKHVPVPSPHPSCPPPKADQLTCDQWQRCLILKKPSRNNKITFCVF